LPKKKPNCFKEQEDYGISKRIKTFFVMVVKHFIFLTGDVGSGYHPETRFFSGRMGGVKSKHTVTIL